MFNQSEYEALSEEQNKLLKELERIEYVHNPSDVLDEIWNTKFGAITVYEPVSLKDRYDYVAIARMVTKHIKRDTDLTFSVIERCFFEKHGKSEC
ncbi:hypothetical protein N8000_07415 [Rhodospirillales bacterium]|nr:hypothetical protein [Rhodospirillales bacterium]